MVSLQETNEQIHTRLLTEQTLREELAGRVEEIGKEKDMLEIKAKNIENQLQEVCIQITVYFFYIFYDHRERDYSLIILPGYHLE